MALAAADAGNAGHWPTVAGILADECRRSMPSNPTKYPRRGKPKDCEFWWYRQSPRHLWATVMVFWGMEIMERCGDAASYPLDECPGEWVGPILPPNAKVEASPTNKTL